MSTHKIGYAAHQSGFSVGTVRYYEREGLLNSARRSDAGYRLYNDADIERLRFIRKAKSLGFTLEDIAELLRLQDDGGSQVEVRERVRERIADLDQKILHLSAIREALAILEHHCAGSGPISDCAIIDGVKSLSLL